jgi:hypothetical protein
MDTIRKPNIKGTMEKTKQATILTWGKYIYQRKGRPKSVQASI